MPGKWNIIEVDSNRDDRWQIERNITFKNDHSFEFSGVEEYFVLYEDNKFNKIVAGGTTSGRWQPYDSSFHLFYDKTYFNTSKDETDGKKALHTFFDGASGCSFGNIPADIFKEKIDYLGDDEITISGYNFYQNCDYRISFKRIEEKGE